MVAVILVDGVHRGLARDRGEDYRRECHLIHVRLIHVLVLHRDHLLGFTFGTNF